MSQPSLRREHRLRDTLTPWSGTCSLNGALLTEKTPGNARSESCCPFCSKDWSECFLPPPLKSMWLWLLPTTTPWMGSRWGSMTGSSGSLGGVKVESSTAPLYTILGSVSSAQSATAGPIWALANIRAEVYLNGNSTLACTSLHQEGWGPAFIFGRRFVPRVWTGGFADNPVAPVWLCAQGSHYSLQGPNGELVSAAPGGGRPSPNFALSRPSIEMLWWQDVKLQDLRPALCHVGRQKGNAVSKQRMAHWIVDAITLAYQAQGVPCLFRLRAHSTRSVASSWALARGASLTDICRAAGWATPNMFARFYSLHVEPVSSFVLISNG